MKRRASLARQDSPHEPLAAPGATPPKGVLDALRPACDPEKCMSTGSRSNQPPSHGPGSSSSGRDQASENEAVLEEGAPAPSYSARLVQPFLAVMKPLGLIPDEWVSALDALDLDFRMPVEVAHQMLDVAVATTKDPTLGLRAAQACTPADAGAVNYVISSAATIRLAIDAAARYMRLVNDAVEVSLEQKGSEAEIRLNNRVPMSRAALDFQVGALYRAFWGIWASGARASIRVCLPHPSPTSLAAYEATFDGLPLVFDAPFAGFAFDASCIDNRLVSGESALHQTLLDHADKMLREMPKANQLTERVRTAIASELAGGNPSIVCVAERFHMSPRTLERRLEREGVTFSAVLDDLRHRLALRHVANHELELAEIAFLLGFSQTTGFHRAFKRWTGQTPLEYRRSHRGAPGAF
jgi:AraC-like DNA-binding protein